MRDVVEFLPLADRCGRRCYRLYGHRALRHMDRDDWIQEARVALLKVFATSYDSDDENPERKLAYAVRCRVLTDVLEPLNREKRRGEVTSISNESVERRIRTHARDIELLEAALDVQRLMVHATPAEHDVLSATLADRFIGSSGAGRWQQDREGQRLTKSQKAHKHRFIVRQRARIAAVVTSATAARERCVSDY